MDTADEVLFRLLAATPPLTEAEARAASDCWRERTHGRESLAAFLVRSGVLTKGAVRTLDMIVKGYLNYPDASNLLTPGAVDALRSLAAASAPVPPAAPVPAPTTVPGQAPVPAPAKVPSSPFRRASVVLPAEPAPVPSIPPAPTAKPVPSIPPAPTAKPVPSIPPAPTAKPVPSIPSVPPVRPMPMTPPVAPASAVRHPSSHDWSAEGEEVPTTAFLPPPAIGAARVAGPAGAAADPFIGLTLGQYLLTARLGRGVRSLVYEADDTVLDRRVAVKLLAPEVTTRDPAAVQKFLVDARIASRLDHPNCLGVYNIGKHAGTVYFAMPLVRGGSADDRLRRGPVAAVEAVRIARLAAMGLAAPHAMGIVHGNLKPSNVLLGESGEVRVCDFGTGHFGDAPASAEATADWLGTPHYMSPEQCRGQRSGPAGDLYSLGATFYALLTGRPPFHGLGVADVIAAHAGRPHPDPRRVNPSIPGACVAVLDRLMAKDPSARFRDAAEAAAALEDAEITLASGTGAAGGADAGTAAGGWSGEGSLSIRRGGPADPSGYSLGGGLSRSAFGRQVGRVTDLRSLQIGSVLGRCLLTEKVGQGGSGIVFRALHQGLNIPVAVKVLAVEALKGDSAAAGQLRAEAQLMAQLNHPNIVRVWDFDDSGDFPYLVMEYIHGLTLRELITQSGALRANRAVRLVSQVAKALACALESGIIHRDVKPANILLTREGGVAKLADLGLAVLVGGRIAGAVSSGTGSSGASAPAGPGGAAGSSAGGAGTPGGEMMVGTAAYMSPEQAMAAGAVDHRSDIYSLGATFYHAVTGQVPFKGRSLMEVMLKHAQEPPVPPADLVADVDPAVSDLIVRMMAKDPGDRPQGYEELLAELGEIAPEPGAGPSASRHGSRGCRSGSGPKPVTGDGFADATGGGAATGGLGRPRSAGGRNASTSGPVFPSGAGPVGGGPSQSPSSAADNSGGREAEVRRPSLWRSLLGRLGGAAGGGTAGPPGGGTAAPGGQGPAPEPPEGRAK
jgi:serine/threonine protein kinase